MGQKPDYVLTRDYLDNNSIWLTDLAKRLPQTVQLDALDISFEATPPAEWLPSNVRTLVWDVKTDPPEDLVDIYDIVHIRHFTLVLLEEEVESVLARLLKLLKPGGYLQWVEVDMNSWHILKTKPENQSDALETLFKLNQGQDKRLSPTYVPSLASRFEAAGFENVKSEARDAPPHLALAMHECNMLISEILARKAKNEKVMEMVKELLPRIETETREGSCWAFTRWSVSIPSSVNNMAPIDISKGEGAFGGELQVQQKHDCQSCSERKPHHCVKRTVLVCINVEVSDSFHSTTCRTIKVGVIRLIIAKDLADATSCWAVILAVDKVVLEILPKMSRPQENQGNCAPSEPLAIVGFAFKFPDGADSDDTFWDMIWKAGIPMAKCAGSNASVYTGSFTNDYLSILQQDYDAEQRHAAMGIATCMLANRISWFFNLKGTSMNIDTACSSSLIALHLACQDLRAGTASMALVGGANLVFHPQFMKMMANANFLAPDSQCWSFDERANGYARGEGIAVLVVKRLEDALRNGDTIRAVIRNTGSNQDGRTPGITQPCLESQINLIKETYRRADIDMQPTRFFEAHGTGTPVGDPIEATAIGRAFSYYRTMDDPLYLGAVKANIGHLEGCSGLAGVIKSLLVLENGVIPPIAKFKSVSNQIDTESLPICVNSFGFGGTNTIIILDDAHNYLQLNGLRGHHRTWEGRCDSQAVEHNSVDRTMATISSGDEASELLDLHEMPKLLVWSASRREGAEKLSESYSELIRDTQCDLRDLSYTLAEKRSHLSWRSFAISSERDNRLSTSKAKVERPIRAHENPGVAFISSGQGGQYHGMGRELYHYPEFKRSLDSSDECLKRLNCPWSLYRLLSVGHCDFQIDSPEYSQPLCTCIQIALIDYFTSMGITPTVVLGHSSGEIAAAYAAGALSRFAAIKVAYYRGVLSSRLADSGPNRSMMAVGLSKNDIAPYIQRLQEKVNAVDIVIGCVNSPKSITLSGSAEQLDIVRCWLENDNIFTRKLRVNVAYHSRSMTHIVDEYLLAMGSLEKGRESGYIPMLSSVTADVAAVDALGSAEYWIRNMYSRVEFDRAMSNLLIQHSKGPRKQLGRSNSTWTSRVTHLLEIGPHSVLQGPISDCLQAAHAAEKPAYISSLIRGENAHQAVLRTVGKLYCAGFQVNLLKANLQNDMPRPTPKGMPRYPFDHNTSYWKESRISRNFRFRSELRHDLLGTRTLDWNPSEARWRNTLRVGELPWLRDHRVEGQITLPAAAMVVMAVEAVRQLIEDPDSLDTIKFENVSFLHPIRFFDGTDQIETQFTLSSETSTLGNTFWSRFRLFAIENDSYVECCKGLVRATVTCDQPATGRSPMRIPFATLGIASWIKDIRDACRGPEVDAYSVLKATTVDHGPCFQNVQGLRLGDSGEAIAEVQIGTWKSRTDTNIRAQRLVTLVEETGVEGEFFMNVGSHLTAVLSGSVDPLELMFKNNLADRFYQQMLGNPYHTHPVKVYLDYLCFKNPSMNFLEVGAGTGGQTSCVLKSIVSDGLQRCARYDYTDVSPAFLSNARERFQEYAGVMRFQVYDLSIDPISQSFQPNNYDVIIASHVLHAVDNLEQALQNIRTLLKPNGKLLLFETTDPNSLPIGFAFGLLRGWWSPLALDSRSQHSPCLTTAQWDKKLKNAGFSGVNLEFEGQQYPECQYSSIIISSATAHANGVPPVNSVSGIGSDIVVIIDPQVGDQCRVASSLEEHLSNIYTYSLQELTMMDLSPSTLVVSLVELNKPLLNAMSVHDFGNLQSMLLKLKNILWVTQAQGRCNPHQYLAEGFGRSLASEDSTRVFVTLALDGSDMRIKERRDLISRVVKRIQEGPRSDLETNFIVKGGLLQIPRVSADFTMNDRVNEAKQQYQQEQWQLPSPAQAFIKLRSPGPHHSLEFCEKPMETQPLNDVELIVEVKCVGLSFRDYLAAIGQLDHSELGMECAGIVKVAGCKSGFNSGDRVCLIGTSMACTSVRIRSDGARALPPDVTFAEGASLPCAVWLAYHSLVRVARIQRGESLLICQGSSTVAQIAIQIALTRGARILALVSSESKRNFLSQTFGIERRETFLTDDPSTSSRLQETTDGKGVDIIFGSLTDYNMIDFYEYLAPHGRLLDISLKPSSSIRSPMPGMGPANLTQASINLAELLRTKASTAHQIFQEAMELYFCQQLKPPQPINIIPAMDIETAFYKLNISDSIGKHIVELSEGVTIDDNLFGNMSHDDWTQSTQSKVAGSWNLHQLLPEGMDFFILISSINGILGGMAQANYAAGNTFEDALARYRIGIGEKAIAIDLGLMVSEGLVAENKSLLASLRSMGHLMDISQDDLMSLLDYYCNPNLPLLSHDEAQVLVGIELPSNVRAKGKDLHHFMRRPIFRHLFVIDRQLKVSSAEIEGPSIPTAIDRHSELRAVPSQDEAVSLVTGWIRVKLAHIMGIPRAEISPEKPGHANYIAVPQKIPTTILASISCIPPASVGFGIVCTQVSLYLLHKDYDFWPNSSHQWLVYETTHRDTTTIELQRTDQTVSK
ncbi:hypothetical protein BDV30DRAFT_246578 [Aspergillus minisclerotigenes]|uniref:Polyketide synthase n=1 Tax=Aspergillus minisclerotigenes TaxID=656917 RepID=A0A5N6JED1_9EURO|nr:hypothetical protein BDV30DRAFT_246578 [Aspergillus minisclerotigenes]